MMDNFKVKRLFVLCYSTKYSGKCNFLYLIISVYYIDILNS